MRSVVWGRILIFIVFKALSSVFDDFSIYVSQIARFMCLALCWLPSSLGGSNFNMCHRLSDSRCLLNSISSYAAGKNRAFLTDLAFDQVHGSRETLHTYVQFVDLRERLNMSLWLLRSVARPSRADRPTFGVSTRPPPPPPRPAAAGRQKLTIVT